MKEEALDSTVWRTGFGKDQETVMRVSVVEYLNSVPSAYEADVHYFGCGSFKISLHRRIRTTGGCSIPWPVGLVFVL